MAAMGLPAPMARASTGPAQAACTARQPVNRHGGYGLLDHRGHLGLVGGIATGGNRLSAR
jgi:hypothetical protein